MFAVERQQAIINLANEKGNVTIAELCAIFNVSSETIRKDLLMLEKHNELIRTHGGAVSKFNNVLFKPLDLRKKDAVNEKRELCTYAMRYIKNGDIIGIDEGSTAVEFSNILSNTFSRLTVVTNSIDVFNILVKNNGIELILCGGEYLKNERAFFGHMTLETIRSIHTNKCFIFPSNISLKFGITASAGYFLDTQKAYMENSDEIYILASSEKIEKSHRYKISDTTDAYTYITDSALSDEIYNKYKDKNLKIIRG